MVVTGYSPPLVTMEDWFQDPHGYQNPQMLKSLLQNGTVQSALCICGIHRSTDTEGQPYYLLLLLLHQLDLTDNSMMLKVANIHHPLTTCKTSL